MKQKGKYSEDKRRKATEKEIETGEKVYVKNVIKENKLTSEFNPTPHTVVNTKGNEAEIRNDITGKQYRRNVVHLKKVEGQWRVCDEEEGNEDQRGEEPN